MPGVRSTAQARYNQNEGIGRPTEKPPSAAASPQFFESGVIWRKVTEMWKDSTRIGLCVNTISAIIATLADYGIKEMANDMPTYIRVIYYVLFLSITNLILFFSLRSNQKAKVISGSQEQDNKTEVIVKEQIEILRIAANIDQDHILEGWFTDTFHLHPQEIKYHLDRLCEIGYLAKIEYYGGDENEYGLTSKGRAFLFNLGLLKTIS